MSLIGSYDEVSQSFTRNLKILVIVLPALLIFLIISFTILGLAIGLNEKLVQLIDVVLGLTIALLIVVKLHILTEKRRKEDKKIGETEKQLILSYINDPVQGFESYMKKQLLILKVFLLIAAIILFGIGMFVMSIIFSDDKLVDNTSGIILAIVPILLSLVLVWLVHSKTLENKIIKKMKIRMEKYQNYLKNKE